MGATAEFVCSICGAFAMRVRLLDAGATWTSGRGDPPGVTPIQAKAAGVRVELPTSDTWLAVSEVAGRGDALSAAIERADAAAIGAVSIEMVPYWCNRCDAVFCEAHWTIWEEAEPGTGWSEGQYGQCPNGHRRPFG